MARTPYIPKVKPPFPYDRPLSWSQLSSFKYRPSQWYKKYVLGEEEPPSKEMLFGKLVGESFCSDTPMAPVVRYSHMEYKFEATLDGITMIGYADSYDPEKKLLREYKTSRKKGYWNHKKVNEHHQLTMYCLMLYLSEKIKPEDVTIHLDYIPVHIECGEMAIVDPVEIHTFKTKRTMTDILKFANEIRTIRAEMLEYYNKQ